MINNVPEMQNFADAVKAAFDKYIAGALALWEAYSWESGEGEFYFDPDDVSPEEQETTVKTLEDGRAALVEEGVLVFAEEYRPFARRFLGMLDKEMESMHRWYLTQNYQPAPDVETADLWGTVGAHNFFFTIVIDALPCSDEESVKAALLERLKPAFDRRAYAFIHAEKACDKDEDNLPFGDLPFGDPGEDAPEAHSRSEEQEEIELLSDEVWIINLCDRKDPHFGFRGELITRNFRN